VPQLVVDLHDGFDHDHVRVFVDDQEVFDHDSVSTRYQIGLAASIKQAVSAGAHSLRVALPARGLEVGQDLDVLEETFVGVALDAKRGLTLTVSDQPFRYL